MRGCRNAPRWIGTLAALACATSCGGDPVPAGSQTPSAQAATPTMPAAARNDPPRIRAVVIEPDDATPGTLVTAKVSASDPNGDPLELSYRWRIDGERLGPNDAVIRIPESAARGLLELEVTALDGKGGSSQGSAELRVANRPPAVTNLTIEPGREIRTTDELTASFRGEDPDGDPIEFLHTWFVDGRPLAVRERRLSGRNLKRDSVIELEVRATDGDLESPRVKSPPIHVVNTPPVIVSTPAGFEVSGAFVYTVRATDEDGDRLFRFHLLEGPDGMTLHWLKGNVRWDPDRQQTGKFPVEIEVDDQHGGTATQSFVLEVDFGKQSQPPAAPES